LSWITDATGLSVASFIFVALTTFGAAAVRGLTGFGMAIILVPLLGLVIRPDQAVVLAILLQFLIGPVGIGTILRDAHRQSALLIGGVAMLVTPLGLWLLARTSPDLARILIAAIAIASFVLVILPKGEGRVPGRVATAATGAMSGLLTGFAAMPGPPVIPYYLRSGLSPAQARASMMLVFFATAIAGTVIATLTGLATLKLAILTLALFPAMLVGNRLGQHYFGTISPRAWQTAVAVVLGVAGVSAVWRAF
jgi:uncharacterized protein